MREQATDTAACMQPEDAVAGTDGEVQDYGQVAYKDDRTRKLEGAGSCLIMHNEGNIQMRSAAGGWGAYAEA